MTYKELDAKYFMPCFGRSMKLVKGEGCTVYDDTGKSYLDMVAGIAGMQKYHPLFRPEW